MMVLFEAISMPESVPQSSGLSEKKSSLNRILSLQMKYGRNKFDLTLWT